jgi:hypothetical protein
MMDKHYYQDALHAALAEVMGRNPNLAELTQALRVFEEWLAKKPKPSGPWWPDPEKG